MKKKTIINRKQNVIFRTIIILIKKNTDSFTVHVKTDDIYKDITQDVETRFDISNFELDRPLPKGKNEKVSRLMKDEMGGQIMNEFVEF